MKISCLQENLHRGLLLVSKIIPSQTQLPILSNVLISANKNGFFLWGTDLEAGIGVEIPAKIEQEGKITTPAKLLLDFVSNLPPEKIELAGDDSTLSVKTGSYKSTIVGIPASEFPPINVVRKKALISIDNSSFKQIVKQTVFATALDETRPVLSGVLLKIDDGKCAFVATDGYRLSLKQTKITTTSADKKTIIIPGRTLKEVVPLVDRGEGQGSSVGLFLGEKENQVEFWVGTDVLVGRLIEGEFPAYEKIIPRGVATSATMDRDEFLRCVRGAAIFARGSANIIKLAVEKEGVIVSANAPQVGETQLFVGAKIEGEENQIAFNSRFVVDFLASVDGKEIVFEMTGPLNPGVFKVKGEAGFFHLIMPVRIQE